MHSFPKNEANVFEVGNLLEKNASRHFHLPRRTFPVFGCWNLKITCLIFLAFPYCPRIFSDFLPELVPLALFESLGFHPGLDFSRMWGPRSSLDLASGQELQPHGKSVLCAHSESEQWEEDGWKMGSILSGHVFLLLPGLPKCCMSGVAKGACSGDPQPPSVLPLPDVGHSFPPVVAPLLPFTPRFPSRKRGFSAVLPNYWVKNSCEACLIMKTRHPAFGAIFAGKEWF